LSHILLGILAERRKACRFLVEKPEGRGLHGRPRHKSEDNIEVNLKEMG